MRFLLLFLFLALPPADAQTQSALDALKLLPKNAAKKLARIEAREGNPAPEQWHFLVYDPEAQNGLREYVVAGKRIIATRDISQFAESLQPGDIIGARALKMDSGKLAAMAEKYALANNAVISSLNYEMHKEGQAATPFWAVTCLDEKGEELGALLVSADDGKLISRTGFPIEPAKNSTAKREKRTQEEIRQSDEDALTEPVPDRRELAIGEEPSPSQPLERSTAPRSRQGTYRESSGPPSIPSVVRKVTKPVRRIVRGLLPF